MEGVTDSKCFLKQAVANLSDLKDHRLAIAARVFVSSGFVGKEGSWDRFPEHLRKQQAAPGVRAGVALQVGTGHLL